MSKLKIALNTIALVVICLACNSLAHAQATRTWVSGVGDDVNPCSRTAPCKTFAGAISKTFINGEIDVLDPGGFGTITITKSITIDGTTGSGFGSILASGTTGVNISIAVSANDPLRTVRLRNLSITGVGASGTVGTRTGIRGVNITNAAAVYIENTLITDFTQAGVQDSRTTGGQLYISSSTIRNNGGSGVVILPSSGSTAITTMVDASRFEGNVNSGFAGSNGSRTTIRDSVAYGNSQSGFLVEGPGGAGEMNLESCVVAGNGTGLTSNTGGTMRISNIMVTNNGTGVSSTGGAFQSRGNNTIAGNTVGNGNPIPNNTAIGPQ
ncbi:MAG TPA: right-handed parallel beta-helix repeat-containing protein [Blastocatellia bacterium]|nr:right-handed parallel beta-helix repeat-containing protein [Blastocatellia bacterium]